MASRVAEKSGSEQGGFVLPCGSALGQIEVISVAELRWIQPNSPLLPLNYFQLFLHLGFGALNLLGEAAFFMQTAMRRDAQAGLFLLQEAKNAFGPYSVPRPEGLLPRRSSQCL